ncbi:MAG: hypothetical protein WCF16_10950 [Alphaproteobacteria bacterium]
MTRTLMGAILAAAILAIPYGTATAAEPMAGGVKVGDKYYPPCTSRGQDNCIQMGKQMKERMGMPGAKMPMHEKGPMGPEVPHGCSPVTTPCT